MVMSQSFRQSPVSYLGLAVWSESLAAAGRVGFRCRFSLFVTVKRLLPFKRCWTQSALVVWSKLFTYYTHTHFDFSAHFLLFFFFFFFFLPFFPPSSDFGTHLEENALLKSGQNEQ